MFRHWITNNVYILLPPADQLHVLYIRSQGAILVTQNIVYI